MKVKKGSTSIHDLHRISSGGGIHHSTNIFDYILIFFVLHGSNPDDPIYLTATSLDHFRRFLHFDTFDGAKPRFLNWGKKPFR